MEEYNEDDYDDLYGEENDAEQDNVFGEDEAEEDNRPEEEISGEAPAPKEKKTKVKKLVLRPQPKLNLEALQGPKGLLALNELFKGFKFRGGGHEVEDYSNILRLLEQWAYRLFPKFHFEDTLKRLEALGKKKEIQVYLRKIRNGLVDNGDVVRNFDDDDDVVEEPVPVSDAFDDLLSQQIAHTQSSQALLSDELKARIERNKKLAMEKRLQKQKEQEASQSDLLMDLDSYDTAAGDELLCQQIDNTQSSQALLSDELKARIERNKKLAMEKLLQRQKEQEASQSDLPMNLDSCDTAAGVSDE